MSCMHFLFSQASQRLPQSGHVRQVTTLDSSHSETAQRAGTGAGAGKIMLQGVRRLYLGVVIDDGLKWHESIANVRKK